ncbi:beta-methylarginine biosynthesis bifunctional aminotransferase [Baia soyae]|uniref:Aminotransferase n=1 Tax=Baia soyae TaxID=1544746 RepID=A0A4R2RS93_9BACL|nr:beta-methylarginine biosynthesis bifunctional aminotransferase [Baia soyae]TCP66058.1 beta-methylarginine biosynthesis bifunctional aminotransferase [Baia soyae]
MLRITSQNSPYTLLQQRLQYIALHPDRPFTILIENVPQWDTPIQPVASKQPYICEYAPCNGYDFLLHGLKERDQSKYQSNVQNENILVTNGAMHALSLIFRSLYKPGGIALVQAPVLGNIADILKASGYQMVYFSSDQTEMLGQLEQLYTDDVRFIYVNTPHNPFGGILSESVVNQLVSFAQDRQVALIADMIYDSYTFEGNLTHSPLVASTDWQHLYTVNSMSKNYGAPGLRIGWITSDAENIKKLSGLCEAECVAISGLSQLQAYDLIQKGNDELVEIIRHRKAYVEQQLTKMENIQYTIPAGGTQFFVKLPVDDIDLFADFVLIAYGLALTTTSNYDGIEGSYIRVPIIHSVEMIEKALELLVKGMEEFGRLCSSDSVCNVN